MLHIHYMLISILSCVHAIECLEVIPERAYVVYINPKYVYPNATVNVRRYSRRSRYYVNAMGTNKQLWNNNMTVTVRISQYLHNEYRPSFVELSRRLCDLVNKEPFVGGALKNAGMVCPLPAGYHCVANITAPTENFPSVFPFEKGRVEVEVTVTDTKESVLQLAVMATFKQKLQRKP